MVRVFSELRLVLEPPTWAALLIVWSCTDHQDIAKDPLYFRAKAGYHRPIPRDDNRKGTRILLKLKRVEIQGFKSFFDRTEMKFTGSGIAAIVGPNGCGKSNLSDAMSWVLGEQSAKSLRGARMEDVIFAGTRDRKPLGLASVTMTLVDPTADAEHPPSRARTATRMATAMPPHKPSEVTITRRLFRSGESEYLIDGKLARLRDIQDLFIGTGLGPESYAIIEQGRIGQILSNKPQDRRAIIEEAAGIGKFKTKKRLAEAKLEGAKQNLSRVFDILEEVGRQVNSLKRQASKARRYEELKVEMIAVSARVADGAVPDAGAGRGQDGAGFESGERGVPDRIHAGDRARAGIQRAARGLLSQRRGTGGGAPAAGRFPAGARADAGAAGFTGAADRRDGAAAGAGRDRNRRSWRSGTQQLRQELEAHLRSVVELEARDPSRRASGWRPRQPSANSFNRRCRSARRRSRPGGRTCCGCWANRRR